MIDFRGAYESDKEQILQLLADNGLPTDDALQHFQHFIVAIDENLVAGCIATEVYGDQALLRSLAVNKIHRNKGIAQRLVQQLESFLINNNVKQLHLLTTTAEKFFDKHGFIKTTRALAPNVIQSTQEFSTLCPDSAVYMVKSPLQNH